MEDTRHWLPVALSNGAEVHRRDDDFFAILNEEGNWLWDALFLNAEAAARAYCSFYRLSWGKRAIKPEVMPMAFALTKDKYYEKFIFAPDHIKQEDFSFWLGSAPA